MTQPTVPGILTINGTDIHVSAFLTIDYADFETWTLKGWWATLTFAPLKPPAADAECTLDLGGTIGRGRIAAGSTRMIGEGPPPTIRRAGDPHPEPEIAPWERQFLNQGTPATDGEPAPAKWDQYIAKDGDLLPNLQAAQHRLQQESLLNRLDGMLANLDAHITRRAQELAQPLIDQAREDAAIEVKSAQGMQQRAEDLNTELRRQLRPLRRQVDEYHQRAKRAEAAVERMRTLIDSYPPGSDFVQCGAAQLFRDHLDGTKGQEEADRG